MMRSSNMGILPYWLIILLITWGLLLYKAEFCLPIDPAYKAIYKKITWGLGRIRTIPTRLDRRKATKEITWGLGRIRTIAAPLDRLKAKRKSLRGQRECCNRTTQTQAPTEHSSKCYLGILCRRNEQRIYTCNRLSSHDLEARCIHLKPRVILPF